MATTADVTRQFFEWNLYGKGADHMRAGAYWFRDKIMYYETAGQWRMVPGKTTPKALLRKGMGIHMPGNDVRLKHMTIIDTPDIGVFTKYELDWMEEGKPLNDRVRFIMAQRIRDLVHNEVPAQMATTLERTGGGFLKQLDGWYSQYNRYNDAVGANWPELPGFYKDQLNECIQKKIAAYNAPEAATRRLRAKARKEAMQALTGGK